MRGRRIGNVFGMAFRRKQYRGGRGKNAGKCLGRVFYAGRSKIRYIGLSLLIVAGFVYIWTKKPSTITVNNKYLKKTCYAPNWKLENHWPRLQELQPSARNHSQGNKVGICVVGETRGLHSPLVRESLRRFVEENNGVVFMELFPIKNKKYLDSTLREEFPNSYIRWHETSNCNVSALRGSACCKLELESQSTAKSWIVRTRPGVAYFESIPLRMYPRNSTFVVTKNVRVERDQWGDWFAASPRERAVDFYDSFINGFESWCEHGIQRTQGTIFEYGPEYIWRGHMENCSESYTQRKYQGSIGFSKDFLRIRGVNMDSFQFNMAQVSPSSLHLGTEVRKSLFLTLHAFPLAITKILNETASGMYLDIVCNRIIGTKKSWTRKCEQLQRDIIFTTF
ncbi:hypothetical protein AAMO2058_000478000 [Amorphochlora amoebiformis]